MPLILIVIYRMLLLLNVYDSAVNLLAMTAKKLSCVTGISGKDEWKPP